MLAVALLTLTPSSAQEPVLPNTPFDYTRQIPAHYLVDALPGPQQPSAAAIDNEPATNRVTDAGATLGRVLFYDRKLSANGTVSCSSCHVQEQGFSDARRLSVGVHGGRTRRHSMGLVNSRFYESGRFFWDERAATLEEQVLQPIQDPVEMDLSLEELVDIVESQAYYPRLFVQAFGDATINTERIGRALAQFVRSINSYNSRYDQGRATVNNANADFPNFSAQENRGKDLFFRPRQGVRCVTCHGTESFSGVRLPGSNVLAMNNGLDAVSTNDLGVFETTNNPADLGKFKTPSLRNVNERAPYMHDGRFATLEDVVAFYSNDIQNHENLAQQLRQNNGQPVRFNFNAQERTDLVAFLRTLSDTSVMSDARFSDPFVETETAVSALSLSSASYQVSEGEQALNVVVVREGSVDPAVDVTLVSQPGSATAGLDFEAVSARLSWGAGEAAMRTVTIPIVDDVLVEDEENFSIALTAFSADATPGSVTSANVVIADDDEFTSTVCVPSSTELCLGESGRFRARLAWSTGEQGGAATAVPLEDGGSSGLFYFFDPTNIEMLLKVLDACTPDLGNRHWIFYAATTDLAFELEVTDTWTGQIRRYSNPEGRVALPVADTQAFDCSLE
ncbi:MAG: cytochrome c peroxidase [Acidobacteriota bacterium]